MSAVFLCLSCGKRKHHDDAQLDREGHLICTPCYMMDPPEQDVDGALNDIAERLRREHWAEMSRAYNREQSGVCDTCGGRTCDGSCGHGCR